MAAIQERYQGLEKHSSGFKLLSAMGWKEGEGLVSIRRIDGSRPSVTVLYYADLIPVHVGSCRDPTSKGERSTSE